VLVRSILGGLACGLASACVLDLPHRIACGDGYVDVEAGEDCDPEAPQDEWSGCGEWASRSCDPVECRCLGCGNGEIELDEECDVGPSGGAVAERLCAGSELGAEDPQPALRPGPDGEPYASGTSTRCNADCTYDRSACSYCGNGVIDPARPLSLTSDLLSRVEVCDGDEMDRDYLNDRAAEIDGYVLCDVGLRHIATCADDCRSATILQNGCCVLAEHACPVEGDALQCCHAFDHAELENHCTELVTPEDPQPNPEGARQCR